MWVRVIVHDTNNYGVTKLLAVSRYLCESLQLLVLPFTVRSFLSQCVMRIATVCITALLVVGVVKGAWSATPVNLTLYGEALCPDTQRFVLRSLSVAMKEVRVPHTPTQCCAPVPPTH